MTCTTYVIVALTVTVAVIILSVVFSWVFARLYCKPEQRLPKKTPADYDLPFEPVTFLSKGVELKGWFIPSKADSASRPPLILAHGWSSNASQMLPVAQALHSAGYDLLLYDVRGHGASGKDGPITIRKFAEDLIAAIDYLNERPDIDAGHVGVVSHSLGASGAILATSMEPRIRALVSSSAFADPVLLTRRAMRAMRLPRGPFLWLACQFINRWLGINMVEIAPQKRISQIDVPILLIHGGGDRFVPPTDMEALFAQANPKLVQSWVIPRRHHLNVLLDPGFNPRVVDFLGAHL